MGIFPFCHKSFIHLHEFVDVRLDMLIFRLVENSLNSLRPSKLLLHCWLNLKPVFDKLKEIVSSLGEHPEEVDLKLFGNSLVVSD